MLVTAPGAGTPLSTSQALVLRNSQFLRWRQTHKQSEHSEISGDRGEGSTQSGGFQELWRRLLPYLIMKEKGMEGRVLDMKEGAGGHLQFSSQC